MDEAEMGKRMGKVVWVEQSLPVKLPHIEGGPTCWAQDSVLYPQLILRASVRCCPPQSFSVPKL